MKGLDIYNIYGLRENMLYEFYNLIAQTLNVPVSIINDESSPETIEGWDSFHSLMLLNDFETAYNIEFTDEDVLNIKKVGDIKTILQQHGVLLDS